MYKALQSPTNVIAISLSGTLAKEDILAIEKIVEGKLEVGGPIGFVIDITALEDASTDAIAEDLRWESGLMSKLDRFPKAAIVSDKNWTSACVKFADRIVPAIEMKSFAPGETEAAIAFASELPTASGHNGPALRGLASDRPDLIAFEFDGKVTLAEAKPIITRIKAAFESNDKIDLLLHIKHFGGFDGELLTDKDMYSFKGEAMKKVRKYAIINAPAWMRGIMKIAGPIVPIKMRHFAEGGEAEARAWLNACC